MDPAGQSARPTYVNDECCSRQSIENHTLQLPPLPAKHFAGLVEGMDYHVQLSVDRAKLKNVTIHITGFSQRSRKMMMNKD